MANDIEDQGFKYLEALIKKSDEKFSKAIQEIREELSKTSEFINEIKLMIHGITLQKNEVASHTHSQFVGRDDGNLGPVGISVNPNLENPNQHAKLECPRFDGCDLHECLYKMEQPLGLDHIVELNKVKVASRPLDDKIPQWFKGPVSSKDLIPINGRPVSDCNPGDIYTMYQEQETLKLLQPSLMKSVDAPQLFEEIPQWEFVPWNAKIGTEFESLEKVNHVSQSVCTQILVFNSSISGWKQELYPDVIPWRPDPLTICLIEGNNADNATVLLVTSTTHNGQLKKVLTAIGKFYSCSIAIEMIRDVIITPPVVEYTSSLVPWLLEVVEEDERDPSDACTCSNKVVPGLWLTFNHTFEKLEWNSEIVLSSSSVMTCVLEELLELVTQITSFALWAVSADALSIPYDMDTIKYSADVVRYSDLVTVEADLMTIVKAHMKNLSHVNSLNELQPNDSQTVKDLHSLQLLGYDSSNAWLLSDMGWCSCMLLSYVKSGLCHTSWLVFNGMLIIRLVKEKKKSCLLGICLAWVRKITDFLHKIATYIRIYYLFMRIVKLIVIVLDVSKLVLKDFKLPEGTLISNLPMKLEDAQQMSFEMKSKLDSLRGAILAITEFQQLNKAGLSLLRKSLSKHEGDCLGRQAKVVSSYKEGSRLQSGISKPNFAAILPNLIEICFVTVKISLCRG